MGILCIKDDFDRYPEKVTCLKSNDKFYHKYGYSERRSCREHDFYEDDVCKWCHQNKKDVGSSGCYHIKKTSFWGLCDC